MTLFCGTDIDQYGDGHLKGGLCEPQSEFVTTVYYCVEK